MRNFQSSWYFRRSDTISSHFNDTLSSFLTQRATINKFPTQLIRILSTGWLSFGFHEWHRLAVGCIGTVNHSIFVRCLISNRCRQGLWNWLRNWLWRGVDDFDTILPVRGLVRHVHMVPVLPNNPRQIRLRVLRWLDWSRNDREWNSSTCLGWKNLGLSISGWSIWIIYCFCFECVHHKFSIFSFLVFDFGFSFLSTFLIGYNKDFDFVFVESKLLNRSSNHNRTIILFRIDSE